MTDISGDPLERLPVRLTERSVREGRQRWDSLGFAESDEDGRFRFANLCPERTTLRLGPVAMNGVFSPTMRKPKQAIQ